MPGLRLGYLLAPPPLRERLIALRLASDLGSPLLLQRTLARFLEQGLHARHLQHVLPHYRERRDTTLAALRSSMPAEVRWSEPRGGLSCWLTLPRRVRVLELYRQALQQGWAFAPGDVFLPEGGTDSHLRLSFGSLAPDDLRRGISVLGELINIELSQAPRTFAPSLELTSLV
jgi:DNA-binding transcriptional MocR family regulator